MAYQVDIAYKTSGFLSWDDYTWWKAENFIVVGDAVANGNVPWLVAPGGNCSQVPGSIGISVTNCDGFDRAWARYKASVNKDIENASFIYCFKTPVSIEYTNISGANPVQYRSNYAKWTDGVLYSTVDGSLAANTIVSISMPEIFTRSFLDDVYDAAGFVGETVVRFGVRNIAYRDTAGDADVAFYTANGSNLLYVRFYKKPTLTTVIPSGVSASSLLKRWATFRLTGDQNMPELSAALIQFPSLVAPDDEYSASSFAITDTALMAGYADFDLKNAVVPMFTALASLWKLPIPSDAASAYVPASAEATTLEMTGPTLTFVGPEQADVGRRMRGGKWTYNGKVQPFYDVASSGRVL